MALGPRTRVLLFAALALAALGALVWYLSTAYWTQPATPLPSPRPLEEPAASATPAESPTPQPPPTPQPTPTPTPQTGPPITTPSGLVIPVAGVRPEQLQDTFNDARSEGRRHDALDIPAPCGTPTLAAADGRVVKLFTSERGGITLYQLGTDERTVYYYAHLERYADGLREGHFARRGETLAYVGDTGNAKPDNCHLHFQIYTVADPKKFWDGEDLNPYELLRR